MVFSERQKRGKTKKTWSCNSCHCSRKTRQVKKRGEKKKREKKHSRKNRFQNKNKNKKKKTLASRRKVVRDVSLRGKGAEKIWKSGKGGKESWAETEHSPKAQLLRSNSEKEKVGGVRKKLRRNHYLSKGSPRQRRGKRDQPEEGLVTDGKRAIQWDSLITKRKRVNREKDELSINSTC